MINFKRGSTKVINGEPKDGTWKGVVLEDGQPGYDRTSNRLKIGDGHSKWEALKWLKGGLEANQVLDSEIRAKIRYETNNEDKTIFTYGKKDPNNDLIGEVYLHQYDGPIETDYVIEVGVDSYWKYRKWHSGLVECWCSVNHTNISLLNEYGTLFKSAVIEAINYPSQITFSNAPTETVTAMPVNTKGHLYDIPIFTCVGAANTKTKTSSIYLCGAESINIPAVTLNYLVKGYTELI